MRKATIIALAVLLPGVSLAEGFLIAPLGRGEGIRWMLDQSASTPSMTCANQLDFSVACNSEYLGKGIIL